MPSFRRFRDCKEDMIIGDCCVFPDYFDRHEIAAISLKALPPGQGFDDGRQTLRQFVPLEIKRPCFAGVRIQQLRDASRQSFNGKTVETKITST